MPLLVQSRTLFTKTAQCFVLNGFIVLGSIALKTYVVTPLVTWLVPSDSDIPYARNILPTIHVLYNVFWLYPVIVLCIALNIVTYQKIALASHALHYRQKSNQTFDWSRIVDQLGSQAYRVIMCFVFFLLTLAVRVIPFVGPYLSLMGTSWLYAFYCFEYSWTLRGWNLSQQIDFFEKRLPFFLGFGFPCALLAHALPFALGTAIEALAFPLCVILATIAPSQLMEHKPNPSRCQFLFWTPQLVTSLLVRLLYRWWAQGQAQKGA